MANKRFLKGLFKDTSHQDQPKDSWRYAKNATINNIEGSISNESGTTAHGHLGTNLTWGAQEDRILGTVEVDNDRVVIFTKNQLNLRSEIGIWDPNTSVGNPYSALYNPNITSYVTHDLNFQFTNLIEGTYKIDAKGDLVVYFTDDLNPPRAINIDRQMRGIALSNITWLYNINPASSHSKHLELLNLFPASGPVPHIYLSDQWWFPKPYQTSVVEGGGLKTAVYYLALAYVDEDLVATNFLTVSNPVSIVDEYDHTRPTSKKDGAKEGTQTSKAISWRVSNLNTDYKFMRPVVVRRMGDSTEAFKLNDIQINPNTSNPPFQTVVFSGIEGSSGLAIEKVIIDTTSYDTAKTIDQLDGILYLGNTTSNKDLGYQKYANAIKTFSVVRDIPKFDEHWMTMDSLTTGNAFFPVDDGNYVDDSKSYRHHPNIVDHKGYQRDEAYAFYIAFIMNDGSMSYAYHIPGREKNISTDPAFHTEGDAVSSASVGNTQIFSDLADLSKGHAQNFHFFDYSQYAGNRNMNFWENATETYPDTDNYEVWDENGYTGTDIKNERVRHHHFPGNDNDNRSSISDDTCTSQESDGVGSNNTPWNGTVEFRHNDDGCEMHWNEGSWRYANMGNYVNISDPDGTNAQMLQALFRSKSDTGGFGSGCNNTGGTWNGNYIVADQKMTVRSWAMINHRRLSNGGSAPLTTTKYSTNSVASPVAEGAAGTSPGCPATSCDSIGDYGGCGGSGTLDYTAMSLPATVLEPGEWIRMRNCGDGWCNVGGQSGGTDCRFRQARGSSEQIDACDAGCSSPSSAPWSCNDYQFIRWEIVSANSVAPGFVKYDAKISHTVRRLGFTLEDIKVPKSIADKVQGFRIYYAKRGQSNKTIIGQDSIIPMTRKLVQMGICLETGGTAEAYQVMGTLQNFPETFWQCESMAYASWHPGYPIYTYGIYQNSTTLATGEAAYKNFTFHDFNLLRTKNSLAGATHIKPQWRVRNLVWNGPTVNQDKRMNTRLTSAPGAGTDPIEIREEWGWETDFNCYPRDVASSIHAGADYANYSRYGGSYLPPRVLGQKAKSYLMGDTIFRGASLGFGGKVFNEFGESCMIFSLMDRHEFRAVDLTNRPTSSAGWNSGYAAPNNSAAVEGFGNIERVNPGDNGPILVNPLPWGSYDGTGGYNQLSHDSSGSRSQSMIVNLHAFKTDVYKSIDSNKLVWTGFEVLGQQFKNFIFWDDANHPEAPTGTIAGDPMVATIKELLPPYTPVSNTANYSVADLQSTLYQGTSNHIKSGIYGGDTYICRYGKALAVKPSNIDESSLPKRSIHYQIVESCDNINFRHTDSDKNLYYPGSIAKEIIRYVGSEDGDFTHFDNMRYNDNYSAVNDIRPAFPLPLEENNQTDFPTRTHRSAKSDNTSLIDNYRIFLGNQFKDLPRDKGDLWKLSTFNNLLYFHMEDTLYVTKGKQKMQLSGGSDAFVGSGDIFEQAPEEIVHTKDGYGGTQSIRAALVTRSGYFFVDAAARKVFLMKENLVELNDVGMEQWFKDNIKFALEDFGLSTVADNPLMGFGFHSVYDPKFKRILLTKREYVPTQLFIDGFNSIASIPPSYGTVRFNVNSQMFEQFAACACGTFPSCYDCWATIEWENESYFYKGGWTISYFPELNIWVSFHDYVPYHYFNTTFNFYSITDQYPNLIGGLGGLVTTLGSSAIWKHHSGLKGLYYQENDIGTIPNWADNITISPFEIEYIENELREADGLYSSITYNAEVWNDTATDLNIQGVNVLEHGFTSFFVYNTHQISGTETSSPLEYLINTRRVGTDWKINQFRDLAAIGVSTAAYYTATGVNVTGGTNVGTVTTSAITPMFVVDGMSELPNANYINLNKIWQEQKKFIDKWLGIRLIYDNITNNSVHLYTSSVAVRKFYR